MRLIVTTNVQIRACVDGAYFPRCSVLYECKYENLNENMLKQCKSSMVGVGWGGVLQKESGGGGVGTEMHFTILFRCLHRVHHRENV